MKHVEHVFCCWNLWISDWIKKTLVKFAEPPFFWPAWNRSRVFRNRQFWMAKSGLLLGIYIYGIYNNITLYIQQSGFIHFWFFIILHLSWSPHRRSDRDRRSSTLQLTQLALGGAAMPGMATMFPLKMVIWRSILNLHKKKEYHIKIRLRLRCV